MFVQKKIFHHNEEGLWILCCASNTPCVLYYTQPQIPTLNFPWDHSQPQLTHCSSSNKDVFPSGDGLFFSDATHVNLSVCCFVQGLAPCLQFWSEQFCLIRLFLQYSCVLLFARADCSLWNLYFFLLSLKFHFFPRIGCNRRAETVSTCVWQIFSGEPKSTNYKNLEYFLPTISSTTLDHSPSSTQSWTAALSSQCCCTQKDGAPDVSCFLFKLFFHAIKCFQLALGRKSAVITEKSAKNVWLNPSSTCTAQVAACPPCSSGAAEIQLVKTELRQIQNHGVEKSDFFIACLYFLSSVYDSCFQTTLDTSFYLFGDFSVVPKAQQFQWQYLLVPSVRSERKVLSLIGHITAVIHP